MLLDITAELAGYENREGIFAELARKMKKVTKKNVYADFSFPRCGKVMGIIRHILQNPKKEQELLKVTGLQKSIVEFFRDYAGNTAYLSGEGEVIKTRQMDVERTQAIVRLVANSLQMALTDEDIITEINESRWQEISKLSEKRARKAKKLAGEVPVMELVPEE